MIKLCCLSLCLISNIASASTKDGISKLESQNKLHLGIFAVQGSRIFAYRENERFAYCSVFKWVLCADILKMSDDGQLDLNRKISYGQKDLQKYSPETSKHLSEGSMSVQDLCSATVSKSDNTAEVLLAPLVGNTSGLQSFVRAEGDQTMRFDRPEPDLNSNEPGDERDTTTPKAMSLLELKKAASELAESDDNWR